MTKEQQAAIDNANKYIKEAKKVVDLRRPVTRAAIEDILEQRKSNELNLLEYL